MKWLCIVIIRFYQRCISPLKSRPTCRFYPTCSAYALEAFEKRGFFVGFVLMVLRILRCHPLSPGGYDPVPEHGLRAKPQRAQDNDQEGADEPKVICEDYVVRRERKDRSENNETDA